MWETFYRQADGPCDKSSENAMLARFLLAGAANTLWGFSIYAVTIYLGAPTWLALASGMLSGIAFNFVSMGAFVFRDLVLARLPRFIFSYIFLFGINFLSLELLRSWVHGEIWGQLILTPPMAAISYLVLSRLVFVKSS